MRLPLTSTVLGAFGYNFQMDEVLITCPLRLTNTGEDSTVLGFAYFPTEYRSTPELDGIYIRSDAFPGGSSRLRQGGTAIHEVGHWLGLFHTFEVRYLVIAKKTLLTSSFRVVASVKEMELPILPRNGMQPGRGNAPLAATHVLAVLV